MFYAQYKEATDPYKRKEIRKQVRELEPSVFQSMKDVVKAYIKNNITLKNYKY